MNWPQFWPVYPAKQLHWYPLSFEIQEPWIHGFDKHVLMICSQFIPLYPLEIDS